MGEKPRILYIDFPTQYLMASTFLRFQEHYESPQFSGRVFSLEEYMDWYAKENGNFTYFLDWSGFNIPSRVFRPFREGKFKALSAREEALIDLLANVPEPFYVIATYCGGSGALSHEIVHGLYHCDGRYQDLVRGVMDGHLSDAQKFWKLLKKMGHHPSVHHDETNAYAITGWPDGANSALRKNMRPLARELKAVFKDYFGFSPNSKNNASRMREFVTKIPYKKFKEKIQR